MRKIVIILLVILLAIYIYFQVQKPEINSSQSASSVPSSETSKPQSNLSRVTKKPFGIYSTPQTSPIPNERFVGWHSGTDFEIFEGKEEEVDVRVMAICSGTLLSKRTAGGYGGVAVQECKIENQRVTVVYGHVKLDSITTQVGKMWTTGQVIGILGKGNSQETDGERKHLHLGIHKGEGIDIKGYVPSQKDLQNWFSPEELLKQGKIENPLP
jgi:murein DD-endopeptidase MepM/ murein hydrolase activator NlpD